MKLITETSEEIKCNIVESATGERQHMIEGVFMCADVENRNKRIYPMAVLQKAVRTYCQEQVCKGRAVGELNHPEGPAINLDKVSHRITDLHWNGSNVIGKALVLNTPMGQIVKGLLEGGCQLGVSSRGMGTVATDRKTGKTLVNNDFVLSTVDIVQDPSAPSAFVNGIMEGVEYFYEGNEIVAVNAEEYKKQMDKMTAKALTEHQSELFSGFLKSLSLD